MTCVTIRREPTHRHFCCDSRVTYGDSIHNSTHKEVMKGFCKIYDINNMYMGYAGYVSDALLLKEYMRTHIPSGDRLDDIERYFLEFYKIAKERNSEWKIEDSYYIVVHMGKAYHVDGYYIYEIDKYNALGTGAYAAKTAMFLGKNAKEAVEVAIEMADGCGGSVSEFIIPFANE